MFHGAAVKFPEENKEIEIINTTENFFLHLLYNLQFRIGLG